MIREEWRDIPGFEDRYQVSNLGNVMSLKYGKSGKPHLMTLTKNGDGYFVVSLSKDGIKKQFKVHRLVGMAFLPNPNNYEMINHINEIKTDNRVENLEWCDVSYNNNYGSKVKKSVEKLSKAVMCVETGKIYLNAREAAEELCVHKESIGQCCRGKSKTCKGYHWQYIN